ncbi:MAG TPA: glycosyltransferase [Actinomycetota bacterium]|nr:glycosyltransferase [Actinomycetota bacterium]
MRILLWHGYLLTGSGSNVLTANVARAWRGQGHDVLLLCQERAPEPLGFVDAHGDLAPGRAPSLRATGAAGAAGRVELLRPAIGEVLPVYVLDEYEGFVAKRFVDLSDDELRAYTDANVAALADAIERFRPDTIVTGHEVMGPYVARRACEATGHAYTAKLHGSALEYAVRPQERYRRYATDGLCAARAVTGGSEYMIRAVASLVPCVEQRASVVNPGCDVELFRPAERDAGDAPVAAFVGKFIPSKGVHDFLVALGLTTVDPLRAVIVGFGSLEPELHALHDALATGDLAAARAVAARIAPPPQDDAARTLASQGAAYAARWAGIEVEWTGRLEHGPLSRRLPYFDALVVPSVLAEAFGMVAIEAAACGVLPVVPAHSGIGEAGAAIEDAIGRPGLLTYDPSEPVAGIAAALDRVLGMPFDERRALGLAAARAARERWSWDTVARALLARATAR